MWKIHGKFFCSITILMTAIVLLDSVVAINTSHPCDDFGDSSIDPSWTVVPKSGSIIEKSDGFLELSYGSSGQRCDWWGGGEVFTAPHIYTNIPTGNFNITTRNLNTAALPSYSHAGFILYLDAENVVFFGNLRDAGLGNGIALEWISDDVGSRNSKAGNYLDQYLRVRKVSDTYYFEYSANGSSWTTLKSCTNALWDFTPTKVGLFMKDWGSYTPYNAQFDYFDITPNCINENIPPPFDPILIVIILIVVILIVVGLFIGLRYQARASRQSSSLKFIQEKPFRPLPSKTQSLLRPPATLQRFCEVCGKPHQIGDNFCMYCGAPISKGT